MYVYPVVLLLVCLACFCGWLVDFCVEFCVQYICFEFVEVVYDFFWFGLLWVRYKGQSLIEDLLFSCCESFVAQVDYCVCGVRLLSSLVSGYSVWRALWGILDQLT